MIMNYEFYTIAMGSICVFAGLLVQILLVSAGFNRLPGGCLEPKGDFANVWLRGFLFHVFRSQTQTRSSLWQVSVPNVSFSATSKFITSYCILVYRQPNN